MYQRNESVPPRLAREGFAPAGPERLTNRRSMLIPKTGRRSDYIPTLKDYSEILCPPERRALREIVETAEVVRENDHVILVARVSSATLDSLATFETSREDLEDGGDHEPSIGTYDVRGADVELDTSDDEMEPDLEPDHDNEYDYLNAEPI